MSDPRMIQAAQRAYHACNRCRKRKARCILNESELGTDISCLRCKRERKPCVFTAERSDKVQRKESQRAGKRSTRLVQPGLPEHVGPDTPTAPHEQSPLRSIFETNVDGTTSDIGSIQDRTPPTDLTERVTQTVLSNQADALNLLFEAAEAYRGQTPPTTQEMGDATSMCFDPVVSSLHDESLQSPGRTRHWPVPMHALAQPPTEILNIFGKLKFVKKGWLTAQEAITYIELFYKNLRPLSPVIDDFYGQPSNYATLVKEEPVLYTTILTISTRYHLLHGDGWLSRGYFLHNRIWRYCQSLLQRVMWGQEKGAKSVTRGLGTIEGILLMAEWHARSLHLPPDIEAWDSDDNNAAAEQTEKQQSPHIPTSWLERVVEPMRRSDRMSWALVQTAASLAQELGILDQHENDVSQNSAETTTLRSTSALHRRRRLRILLYVYMNRLAVRIGMSPLIPQALVDLSPTVLRQISKASSHDSWFDLMFLWVDLTRLMRTASDLLFSSKSTTQELIRSGGYRRLLEHFRPVLENWWAKYSSLTETGPLKDLLEIDFMYAKVFVYSLALQAVAEKRIDSSAGSLLFPPLDREKADYEHIKEVIDGAKGILNKTLSFSPTGSLRFLPVRVYVSVVSACVFLLKAVALGVRQNELNSSLDLIDQTAWALRLYVVDDLHLAGVFATLLETYTQRFRSRFTPISTAQASTSRVAAPTNWSETNIPTNVMPDSLAADMPLEGNPSQLLDGSDMNQDWLAYPFDPSIAPFGAGIAQGFCNFDDELNFVWNASA